jgi:hypothetical protein
MLLDCVTIELMRYFRPYIYMAERPLAAPCKLFLILCIFMLTRPLAGFREALLILKIRINQNAKRFRPYHPNFMPSRYIVALRNCAVRDCIGSNCVNLWPGRCSSRCGLWGCSACYLLGKQGVGRMKQAATHIALLLAVIFVALALDAALFGPAIN